MSKSVNDTPFWGGSLRTKATHTKAGSIQLRVYLIDPATSKPYTFTGILKAMHQREQEYPNLHDAIEAKINEIKIKEKRRHGATVFSYYVSAANGVDLAEKKQTIKERLEPLARILYRPQYLSFIKNGNVTIAEFLVFLGDAFYVPISTESARKGVKTAMRTKILPAIGSDRIDDYIRNEGAKEDALARIARILDSNLAKENVRQYTNRALHLLFSVLDEYGVPLKGGTYLPRRRFDIGAKRNYDVGKQLVPDHMDDMVRNTFIEFLKSEPKYAAELLWVALVYSGVSPNEIVALRYQDIEAYEIFGGGQTTKEKVFTCLITKTLIRSDSNHWRQIDVCNQRFVMSKARRVVLVPWVVEPVQHMLVDLHESGISASDMTLSMTCDGVPRNPDDIRIRIQKAMQASRIFPSTTITRQRKSGTVIESYSASYRLLESDARYVAEHICGMPLAMFHTTFGLAPTMTDEQHYLDILSDDFAVCRYYYLRRFYPKVFLPQSSALSNEGILAYSPSLVQITVKGNAEKDGKLILETNLGVDIAWETE